MSRLGLLLTRFFAPLLVVACGASAPEGAAGEQAAAVRNATPRVAAASAHLRVVASNLTSGNGQSYDPGEGIRILQALAPDVALMQELNYGNNTDEELRGFVDETFGSDFVYSRETGAQIPNGVVSRYPIVESGAWTDPQVSNRKFAWARIDVPGDKDLWAVSVHLLTSSSSRRQAEASELVARIRATVPESDYLVLGGDFNSGSRTESCVRTLGQVLTVTGPYPADSSGNTGTSADREDPYDWVLADRDLDAHRAPAVVGGLTFPAGLVFDSRVFRPLDAVAPVRSGDSGAQNMQHMAVVRDFELPVEPAGAIEAAAP